MITSHEKYQKISPFWDEKSAKPTFLITWFLISMLNFGDWFTDKGWKIVSSLLSLGFTLGYPDCRHFNPHFVVFNSEVVSGICREKYPGFLS